METIYEQAVSVLSQIKEKTNTELGNLLVVGCSTSTVLGDMPGTNSSEGIAEQVYRAVAETFSGEYDIAVQCCEHLNRALVVERSVALKYGFLIVNAVPYVKGGGAFATLHYNSLKDPVVVEDIKAMANLGIDIGGVMIGMHMRPVVVPLKLEKRRIGDAHILAGSSRLKYVGGERTHYK
ncbi:MAG: TIGR01440 family protein [Lachnospiraceae bacterium]|nr:TIGR01440 family protein [Lachnospiraceae bacterium]